MTMTMKYYLKDICCLCLNISNEHLNDLSANHPSHLNHFEKIATTLLGLSSVMEMDSKICTKCSETVDFIYNFNKTCLKNIKILSSYKEMLKDNMVKKQGDVYVSLNISEYKLKQSENSLNDVKVESADSSLNNDYEKSIFENYGKEMVKIKEEEVDHDSYNETILYDSGMNKEIDNVDVKMERIDEMEDESLRSTEQDQGSTSEQQLSENVLIKKEDIEVIEEENFLKIEENFHETQDNVELSKCHEQTNYLSVHEKLIKVRNSCDGCGKTFDSNSQLCDICESSVSLQNNSQQQVLIHIDDKPYKCDECYKTFKNKRSLVNHKLIHSGEKPHICDQCDKRFTEKTNLIKHKRIHTGERPYECEFCGKAFTVKSTLTTHRRVHTGEKPFSCHICQKSFRDGSAIVKHKRNVHHL